MAETSTPSAAIYFEPDGYDLNQTWLMGRQVAGNGFLRAYVSARGPGPVRCYTAQLRSAQAFARMVKGMDSSAECGWVKATKLDAIGQFGGVLYLPHASLPGSASARLRVGVARYSICGVTHTTATPRTLQTIADLLTAPVAPWDALICTSAAVAETVRRVHEAEAEALRWRLGGDVRIATPQLPIIPLGVHCSDYEFKDGEREAAREALGLAPEDVVALFVGRLTVTGKHHPFAMYRALQAAAERSGRRLVLVQCGWSPNEAIEAIFTTGAEDFAPGVRAMIVDGRDDMLRRRAWAAADLFMSVSDNIQETFGLTPIEAMAAGLPCVVSDWNGYKDTVGDGIDGFRVRTWAPMPRRGRRSDRPRTGGREQRV